MLCNAVHAVISTPFQAGKRCRLNVALDGPLVVDVAFMRIPQYGRKERVAIQLETPDMFAANAPHAALGPTAARWRALQSRGWQVGCCTRGSSCCFACCPWLGETTAGMLSVPCHKAGALQSCGWQVGCCCTCINPVPGFKRTISCYACALLASVCCPAEACCGSSASLSWRCQSTAD